MYLVCSVGELGGEREHLGIIIRFMTKKKVLEA